MDNIKEIKKSNLTIAQKVGNIKNEKEANYIYRLDLIYPINANLYDENQKPLWPQGIARWPITLKDKKEFEKINQQLKSGKDVLVIDKGGEYNSGLRVNLQNVLVAEMNVYIPQEESLILAPTGDKFHKSVN